MGDILEQLILEKEFYEDSDEPKSNRIDEIVEYIQKLKEENKKLRDALQKYTHEEVRGVYIKEFLIEGHNYDNSCFACTEYNKGELARKTLKKINKDIVTND